MKVLIFSKLRTANFIMAHSCTLMEICTNKVSTEPTKSVGHQQYDKSVQ